MQKYIDAKVCATGSDYMQAAGQAWSLDGHLAESNERRGEGRALKMQEKLERQIDTERGQLGEGV